jgi:hypothetical protein
MPIRVKPLNRRDSRDSLTSTDNLISVYSLESKDASFEAYASVEMSTQQQGTLTTGPPETEPISNEATAWSKSPWALCFPPQLQMNVQQISEHLKVQPANYKLTQSATLLATASTSNKSPQHKSDTHCNTTNTKRHSKGKSSSRQDQNNASIEGSYGYEFEHKEDVKGNIYALPLEQSAVVAFSDDDSVTSWSSQNAVKFKKKRKSKLANHGPTAASSAFVDPGICAWEHPWGGNPDQYLESKETDVAPAEHRAPKDSSSKEAATLFQEKRDESEGEPPLMMEPQVRPRGVDELQEDEYTELQTSNKPSDPVANSSTTGATSVISKKSVRFTHPVVTSQHFRPRTRPEEVSLLFFDEDELDLLEEDRETTSRDQFEMIAQELSENRLRISIAYQNRWRDHQRRRSSSSSSASSGSTIQVAASASDA